MNKQNSMIDKTTMHPKAIKMVNLVFLFMLFTFILLPRKNLISKQKQSNQKKAIQKFYSEKSILKKLYKYFYGGWNDNQGKRIFFNQLINDLRNFAGSFQNNEIKILLKKLYMESGLNEKKLNKLVLHLIQVYSKSTFCNSQCQNELQKITEKYVQKVINDKALEIEKWKLIFYLDVYDLLTWELTEEIYNYLSNLLTEIVFNIQNNQIDQNEKLFNQFFFQLFTFMLNNKKVYQLNLKLIDYSIDWLFKYYEKMTIQEQENLTKLMFLRFQKGNLGKGKIMEAISKIINIFDRMDNSTIPGIFLDMLNKLIQCYELDNHILNQNQIIIIIDKFMSLDIQQIYNQYNKFVLQKLIQLIFKRADLISDDKKINYLNNFNKNFSFLFISKKKMLLIPFAFLFLDNLFQNYKQFDVQQIEEIQNNFLIYLDQFQQHATQEKTSNELLFYIKETNLLRNQIQIYNHILSYQTTQMNPENQQLNEDKIVKALQRIEFYHNLSINYSVNLRSWLTLLLKTLNEHYFSLNINRLNNSLNQKFIEKYSVIDPDQQITYLFYLETNFALKFKNYNEQYKEISNRQVLLNDIQIIIRYIETLNRHQIDPQMEPIEDFKNLIFSMYNAWIDNESIDHCNLKQALFKLEDYLKVGVNDNQSEQMTID